MTIVDKKVELGLKSGAEIYFTNDMLKQAMAKYPNYSFVEVTPTYPIPKKFKAYKVEV